MQEPEISKAIERYSADRPRHDAFGDALRTLLRQLADQDGIDLLDIEFRSKDPESLRRKLDGSKYEDLDDIDDLCGVRVIVYYQSDVEKLFKIAERELHLSEVVHHGAEDDEHFGYSSLHVIASVCSPRSDLPEWAQFAESRAEIQIRTVLQHAWAAISHKLDYKSSSGVPSPSRRKLFRVAALLESGDELFDEFRDEVVELRTVYSVEASTEDWRSLPVNEDSLPTIWDRFDWKSLSSMAEDRGWRRASEIHATDGFLRNKAIPKVAKIAGTTGIETAGDVESFLELTVSLFDDDIEEIGRLSKAQGFIPLAIPSDVLIAGLAVTTQSVDPADYFRPELAEAVSAARRRLFQSLSSAQNVSKKAPAKKTPAKKTPAQKTPPKKTPAKRAPAPKG